MIGPLLSNVYPNRVQSKYSADIETPWKYERHVRQQHESQTTFGASMSIDAVATQRVFGVLCHQVTPFPKHPKYRPNSETPAEHTKRPLRRSIFWQRIDGEASKWENVRATEQMTMHKYTTA